MKFFTTKNLAGIAGRFSLMLFVLLTALAPQLSAQICASEPGRGFGSVNCGGDRLDICDARLSFNQDLPRPFGDDCRFITYAFVNGTSDIGGDYEHQIVERALAKWDAICGAVFIPACSVEDADIRFSWAPIDGDPVGHEEKFAFTCDVPGGCDGGSQFGDVVFDSGNTWTTSYTDDWDHAANLETMALHEIGHVLGIGHTSVTSFWGDSGNVMFSRFFIENGTQTYLGCNDVANAHYLHGPQREEVIGANTVFAQPTRSYTYSIGCIPEGYRVRWIVDYPFFIVGRGTGATVTLSLDPRARSANPRVGVELINDGCGSLQLIKRVKVIGGSLTTGPGCSICPVPLTGPTDGPIKALPITSTIYPNPVVSGGNINISLSTQSEEGFPQLLGTAEEVMIYDLNGRNVLRTTSLNSINTATLEPGVYIVKVSTSEATPQVATHKLLVK